VKKSHAQPPMPEDKTFGVSFRYVNTRYADAAAYKQQIVVTMPDDRTWMNPRDATRFARAILAAVAQQRKIDAWHLRYRPDSYEGKVAAKRALSRQNRRGKSR
jgi:hypothetical protein